MACRAWRPGWRNYWIEAAFWDIRDMVEGKPVWPLLGGKDAYAGRALVYASTGEVHPPDWRAEEVLQIEYPYEPPGWIPEARDGLLAEPIRID